MDGGCVGRIGISQRLSTQRRGGYRENPRKRETDEKKPGGLDCHPAFLLKDFFSTPFAKLVWHQNCVDNLDDAVGLENIGDGDGRHAALFVMQNDFAVMRHCPE